MTVAAANQIAAITVSGVTSGTAITFKPNATGNAIVSATASGTTITATVPSTVQGAKLTSITPGRQIVVSGAAGGTWSNINGTWTVRAVNPSANTITFQVTTAPTGTYTASSALAGTVVQAGDLLIATLGTCGTVSCTLSGVSISDNISGTTGWSVLFPVYAGGSSSTKYLSQVVYWKTAVGGETSVTPTYSGAGNTTTTLIVDALFSSAGFPVQVDPNWSSTATDVQYDDAAAAGYSYSYTMGKPVAAKPLANSPFCQGTIYTAAQAAVNWEAGQASGLFGSASWGTANTLVPLAYTASGSNYAGSGFQPYNGPMPTSGSSTYVELAGNASARTVAFSILFYDEVAPVPQPVLPRVVRPLGFATRAQIAGLPPALNVLKLPVSGSTASTVVASATLTVTATLAGTTQGSSTASGTLSTSSALAGTSAANCTASATLSASVALSATATAASTASGSVTVGVPLSGATSSVVTASGTVGAPGALMGVCTATTRATGTLSVGVVLVGTCVVVSTGTATFSARIGLSGTAAANIKGSGTLSAFLPPSPPPPVILVGTTAIVSDRPYGTVSTSDAPAWSVIVNDRVASLTDATTGAE